MSHKELILAAAGRRIDRVRFPEQNERKVAKAIRSAMNKSRPSLIVSSAACGADILVLEAAREIGIPTRIILPFSVRGFRQRSVEDCNGNWASRFDAVIADKTLKDGSLVLLTTKDSVTDDEAADAYHQVTDRVIREVAELVQRDKTTTGGALLVWDAIRKAENDETGYFLDRAQNEGWRIVEIATM